VKSTLKESILRVRLDVNIHSKNIQISWEGGYIEILLQRKITIGGDYLLFGSSVIPPCPRVLTTGQGAPSRPPRPHWFNADWLLKWTVTGQNCGDSDGGGGDGIGQTKTVRAEAYFEPTWYLTIQLFLSREEVSPLPAAIDHSSKG
jgi:hypothetical protein